MAKRADRIVRLSTHAREDMLEIGVYLMQAESATSAARVLRRIIAAAESLAKNALLWRERNELFSGGRVVLAHPYAVVYRVDDVIVHVVRIVHGRRDLEALFVDEREI